ncbi:phage protein [Streptococcus pyogenes]|nr:phage protein [Streptococcus pyogenes]
MRYADRVTFVKTTDEQYNPDLGEYTHTEVISITNLVL